jgi:hypothetical protein
MLRSPSYALALGAIVLASCSSSSNDPPMTRSCRGEYVNECRPYTYARITAATLTPDRITLSDPSMRATVHVEFTRCDMAPLPLFVQIDAYDDSAIGEPDGGTSMGRVIPLTMIGPVPDGATTYDVTIDNPFFANVPVNSMITLQFSPIIDDCQGEMVAVPYHTGTAAMGP